MTTFLYVVFLGVVMAGVMVLADCYYRLLARWCPPDPPYEPPDTTPYRLARRRRSALERMWQRRPFDQELE